MILVVISTLKLRVPECLTGLEAACAVLHGGSHKPGAPQI